MARTDGSLRQADALYRRGNELYRLGRMAEALASLEAALGLQPRHPGALLSIGATLHQLGRFDAALQSFDRLLSVQPKSIDALYNRGTTLLALQRWSEALLSYDRVLALRSGHADAWVNRGLALQNLHRQEEALASFDQALKRQPRHVEAHNNRGTALQNLNRHSEALASFDQAIALRPNYADALNNRGNALDALDRPLEALESIDRALRLRPDFAMAWNNRGVVLRNLNRLDEALQSTERAMALQPQYPDAHWNRSLILLMRGDFRAGWAEYEWRLSVPSLGNRPRPYAQPRWRGGEDLTGKTILVYAEQGLGDTLQFCRYTSLLADRGARVVLEVQRSLRTLLAGLAGVDELLCPGDELPPFDLYSPLLSLPLAFATDLESIPAPRSYLAADPLRVEVWRSRLHTQCADTSARRIGLVWAGNPSLTQDRHRSIPLASLLLLAAPGLQLCSLQKDLRPGDRELLAAHPEIPHFGDELNDFADTAALIESLDLVISVDTAVAHLAGALGKPVWILQRYSPDFRWLLGRDDSPWYPSARLFRQPQRGDWDSVIAELATARERFLA
ncbi:MAG: tetratricopeptide repeat-containing glycosyltransferase family protein [Gammaproteobacteria bacterium]